MKGDRGVSEEVRHHGDLREQRQEHDDREAQEARSTKAFDHQECRSTSQNSRLFGRRNQVRGAERGTEGGQGRD
jgi:hypothetical protein